MIKEIRWYLWRKLSSLRYNTPQWLTDIIDWVRYEILWNNDDDRFFYD